MTGQTIYKDTPSHYHFLLDLIETNKLLFELENSKMITLKLFEQISLKNENFSYQLNKWTTKEIIRHIIDCERIFAYRALRFSRFDNSELLGFDEDAYVVNLKSIEHNFINLKEEYEIVRNSNIALFKKMTNEMLNFKGLANKMCFTAKTLGFMIIGHNLHHCNFMKNKYLN